MNKVELHRLKRQFSAKGITLIEIMIAFAILCTAVFSTAGAISYGHRGTTKDFRRGEALQLLVDRMNKLSSLPYESLNKFLKNAGGNEYCFKDPLDEIVLGDSVKVGKYSYEIHATLKRQSITFDSLMELSFPNSAYRQDLPSTWIFKNRTSESFDGAANPFAVIKITVSVKAIGGITPEKAVEAITFVADLENKKS